MPVKHCLQGKWLPLASLTSLADLLKLFYMAGKVPYLLERVGMVKVFVSDEAQVMNFRHVVLQVVLRDEPKVDY